MPSDDLLRELHERMVGSRPDLVDLVDYDTSTWTVLERADGLRVAIMPMLYTAAIIVDRPPRLGYLDRWCYHSVDDALAAARAWDATWPETEPAGWHRHPSTGRRRPHGIQNLEYIEP